MFQLEWNCAGFIKLDEAGAQAGARISPLRVEIRARLRGRRAACVGPALPPWVCVSTTSWCEGQYVARAEKASARDGVPRVEESFPVYRESTK